MEDSGTGSSLQPASDAFAEALKLIFGATPQVFGYSSAFGPAPHEVAAALLRKWLPLHAVETSYEGY